MAIKRAITLAGGGPAAGLHIGVLERLNEAHIKFDVWAGWFGVKGRGRRGNIEPQRGNIQH